MVAASNEGGFDAFCAYAETTARETAANLILTSRQLDDVLEEWIGAQAQRNRLAVRAGKRFRMEKRRIRVPRPGAELIVADPPNAFALRSMLESPG